jgi:hypothetical protein
VLTIIMFLQIIATLFDDAVFSWKDQYLLTYIYQFSDYIHVFDAVENSESATYYLLMYCSCKLYISNNIFPIRFLFRVNNNIAVYILK